MEEILKERITVYSVTTSACTIGNVDDVAKVPEKIIMKVVVPGSVTGGPVAKGAIVSRDMAKGPVGDAANTLDSIDKPTNITSPVGTDIKVA